MDIQKISNIEEDVKYDICEICTFKLSLSIENIILYIKFYGFINYIFENAAYYLWKILVCENSSTSH